MARVAKFRVEIERVVKSDLGRNPFHPIHISMNMTSQSRVRVWEFEAKDEADARRLFKEAQDMDLPNVRGFTLRSVKLLDGDSR